jgi:hypothetical protein
MKKQREQEEARSAPVQYRAGAVLGQWLEVFARRHRLTLNEAAKRLAGLALAGLTSEAYGDVQRLAEEMKSRESDEYGDFLRACEVARTMFDTVNMIRHQDGDPRLVETEKWELLAKKVGELRSASSEKPSSGSQSRQD